MGISLASLLCIFFAIPLPFGSVSLSLGGFYVHCGFVSLTWNAMSNAIVFSCRALVAHGGSLASIGTASLRVVRTNPAMAWPANF